MKTGSVFLFVAMTAISTTSCGNVPNISDYSIETQVSDAETDLKILPLNSGFNLKSGKIFKPGDTIPERYIVRFKDNIAAENILGKYRAKKIGTINKTMNIMLVEKKADPDFLNLIRKEGMIDYIEEDKVISLDEAPVNSDGAMTIKAITPSTGTVTVNDPLFASQYAMPITKAVQGWAISKGSNTNVIAIIDTGIDGAHPDFSGKIVPGYSVYYGISPTKDGNGHGTHCSGIAAAMLNNNVGIAGFSPLSKIMPVKVLDDTGLGTISAIASGIHYAANSNASVLSMSFGSASDSKTLHDAVNYALSKNKIVVAAIGNRGDNTADYPAAYSGVIAVGATDNKDLRASYSQYGHNISVVAPGSNILSTLPGKSYGYLSGTSMATPAVAGLAGLLKGYRTTLTAAQIKQRIQQGADDLGIAGYDQYYGYGRINVYKTLALN
jgi:subtilisin family serine protease